MKIRIEKTASGLRITVSVTGAKPFAANLTDSQAQALLALIQTALRSNAFEFTWEE